LLPSLILAAPAWAQSEAIEPGPGVVVAILDHQVARELERGPHYAVLETLTRYLGTEGQTLERRGRITALSGHSTNSGGAYQVRLAWTDSNEDEGYYVYRGASIESALSNVIASLAQNVTAYTNSPVQTNTTYTYLVRAVKLFNSGGGSFYQLSRAATTNITVNP
jgi:hypothetical protein